jgi:hypothetical protein
MKKHLVPLKLDLFFFFVGRGEGEKKEEIEYLLALLHVREQPISIVDLLPAAGTV